MSPPPSTKEQARIGDSVNAEYNSSVERKGERRDVLLLPLPGGESSGLNYASLVWETDKQFGRKAVRSPGESTDESGRKGSNQIRAAVI